MGPITVKTAILASGLTVPYAETGNPAATTPVVFVHAYVESWRRLHAERPSRGVRMLAVRVMSAHVRWSS